MVRKRNITPAVEVVRARIAEARKRRAWTQEALASRLREIGHRDADRTLVAKIESGARREITVTELLTFAVALDVPPVHLLAPLEDDAPVAVTSKITPPARLLRKWIRAEQPMWSKESGAGNWRAYLLAFPESELQDALEQAQFGQARSTDGLAAEFLEVDTQSAAKAQERAEDRLAEAQIARRKRKETDG
jgi:transcriptional regulator with XRE-family HTH domain